MSEVRGGHVFQWMSPQDVIRLVSGRWTLPALAELRVGGRRYRDIYDALNGISHKVLTDTLRRAERDGLISRYLDPERVETATLYQLTDLGRSLDEPLGALGRWADSSWRSIEDARLSWDRRSHKVRSDQSDSSHAAVRTGTSR